MFYIRKLFLLYGFCYFTVECLIPGLNVQKVDRKLIERKRQDTRDMCRMFTEENNRLNSYRVVKHKFVQNPKRIKRELEPANPNLDLGDAQRVETIIDRLYDDMAEHGERVAYRQRNLSAVKPPIHPQNQTARRFFFAPASIMPAETTTREPLVDDTIYQIPWLKNWTHGIIPYFIDPNTYGTCIKTDLLKVYIETVPFCVKDCPVSPGKTDSCINECSLTWTYAHLSNIILRAFDYFEKATCIRLQRLRKKPTDIKSLREAQWLYITNPSGIRQCVHSNERKPNRGVQMVVFGYDCLSLGEILHEVMHVLGFSHEHTRPDRDQYITVLWDNIKPGYKKYFEVRTSDPLSNFPYDYASVLHYPSRAFSKNGQVTLLVESGVKVGQREALSDNDIAKVTTIFSPECTKRNKEYLLKTCPSVVKIKKEPSANITQNEIENYFKDRIWNYGLINYRIKDNMQFTSEERENLNAVFHHIEKETCIEFRDISVYDDEENTNNYNDTVDSHLHMKLGEELLMETNRTQPDDDEDDSVIDNQIDSNITNINEKKPQSIDDATENEKSKDTEENVVSLRKEVDSNTDTVKNSKKHLNSTAKSVHTFGKLFKGPNYKRKRSQARMAGRRHAESILTLVRSQELGCSCPPPGRPKGDKILKINSDCFNSVNDLLHLFVHVLGLDHQHNMHDRDSYIHILWENLSPEISNELQNKLPPAAAMGFPYDYQSVMHYPWLDIKDGVTNIMYPIWNDGWAMGHWQGLSSTDVNKLNLIYFEQCALRKQEVNKDDKPKKANGQNHADIFSIEKQYGSNEQPKPEKLYDIRGFGLRS